MKIYKISLSKEDLRSLPASERVFLIYAGHTLNELNILCRMVVHGMPIRRSEAERQFMVAQSLMFLRILAGKLHEMWVLFKKAFYKSKLSLTFKDQLSAEWASELEKLNRYFSQRGVPVSAVRHLHAFHYDLEQVDNGLLNLGPRMSLDIYFDENAANTLYGFADNVINSSVMAAIDKSSPALAFETLLKDTEDVAKSFQQVLEGLMSQIFMRHLPKNFVRECVTCENVNSTDWTKMALPTFVESPGPWTVTLSNNKVLSWEGQHIESPAFLRDLLND